jgi:molecular chaperone GrpE
MSCANSNRALVRYHKRPLSAAFGWSRLQAGHWRLKTIGVLPQTPSEARLAEVPPDDGTASALEVIPPDGGTGSAAWPEADELLERFRGWLDLTREETEAAIGGMAQAVGERDAFGLVELVREFTALRHEVKLQTKSARGLDEQAAAAISALDSAGTSLEEAGRQFRAVKPKEAEAARRAALPMILALADLDEALARGAAAMEAACRRLRGELADAHAAQVADAYSALPRWKRWLCRDWHAKICELGRAQQEARMRIVDSLSDGYAMVRKRLERSMAKKHLSRIVALGAPVDPREMTVVEVVETADAPNCPPGTVVEEIRPGYRWNGRVVRFAEVRAVREAVPQTESTSSLPA